MYIQEIGSPEIKLKWQFELYDEDKSGICKSLLKQVTVSIFYLCCLAGNINEEEFVQIFVQIFDGEDTGKPKTEYKNCLHRTTYVYFFKIVKSFREERDGVIEKAKEMFSELDDSGDGEMSLVK